MKDDAQQESTTPCEAAHSLTDIKEQVTVILTILLFFVLLFVHLFGWGDGADWAWIMPNNSQWKWVFVVLACFLPIILVCVVEFLGRVIALFIHSVIELPPARKILRFIITGRDE
jgi:hypothetical protein